MRSGLWDIRLWAGNSFNKNRNSLPPSSFSPTSSPPKPNLCFVIAWCPMTHFCFLQPSCWQVQISLCAVSSRGRLFSFICSQEELGHENLADFSAASWIAIWILIEHLFHLFSSIQSQWSSLEGTENSCQQPHPAQQMGSLLSAITTDWRYFSGRGPKTE